MLQQVNAVESTLICSQRCGIATLRFFATVAVKFESAYCALVFKS